MIKNLYFLSIYVFLVLQFTYSNVQAADPIKFTIKTNAASVSLDEEMEFTITADLLHFPTNTAFIFKDQYSFSLKLVVPDGFKQTGGTYRDYVGTTLSAKNPSVSYTIKGKFVKESNDHEFILLRGSKDTNDHSQFAYVTSVSYTIQYAEARIDSPLASRRRIIFSNKGLVPYLTRAQLYAGIADTAIVVKVIQPRNGKVFTFAYDSTNTTAANDSFRVIVVGAKRYMIQEPAITPEQFGAMGDGILDDHQAFVNAIAYMKSLPASYAQSLMCYAPAYEFKNKVLTVDRAKISLYGNNTNIENGQINFSAATWSTRFDFTISGFNFVYDTFNKNTGADRSGRFGIYVKNVVGGTITNNTFRSCNAGVYFEPTGYVQAIKTITISNNLFGTANYGIWIPEQSDATKASYGSEEPNRGDRLVGDLTIVDNEFRGPELDGVNLYGIDGLQYTRNLMFMPDFLNRSGYVTKRDNFSCKECTYGIISDCQFFEAGRDAVRLAECDLFKISNSHMALPGQTYYNGNGIHIIKNIAIDNTKTFESVAVENVTIDGCQVNSVRLEGSIDSYGYTFRNIHIRRFAQLLLYHGDEYGIGRPMPSSGLNKRTLLADKNFHNVTFEATVDTYDPRRHASILGNNGSFHEWNFPSGTEVKGSSMNPTGFTDLDEKDDKAYILENKFPYSSSGYNLNSSSSPSTIWAETAATIVDTVVFYGPRGIRNAPIGKITASTANTSHFITTSGVMSIAKSAGDSSYHTFSGYFKTPEKSDASIITLILASEFSVSKGAYISFDLANGEMVKSGGTLVGGGGRTSEGMFLRSPTLVKDEDGWYKLTIVWRPRASALVTNVRIYLNNSSTAGDYVFAGTSNSIIYMADFQLSNTSKELIHTSTTGFAQQRIPILYNSTTSGSQKSTTRNAAEGAAQRNNISRDIEKKTYSAKLPSTYSENLLIQSKNFSPEVWTKTQGISSDIEKDQSGLRAIHVISENSTAVVQRGFYPSKAIVKADSLTEYTLSFDAKAGEVRYIQAQIADNDLETAASIDIDLLRGTLTQEVTSGEYVITGKSVRKIRDDFFHYTLTVKTSPGSLLKPAFFLKSNSKSVNEAYPGTIGNKFFLSNLQFSKSDIGQTSLVSDLPFQEVLQTEPVIFPVYNDNASAKAGGLTVGTQYRTSAGVLMVVF